MKGTTIMFELIAQYPVASAIVSGVALVLLMIGVVVGTVMSED